MADGLEFFELNKRYDMLEIKFPFLEYTLSDGTVIRFVTGTGMPVRAHGLEVVGRSTLALKSQLSPRGETMPKRAYTKLLTDPLSAKKCNHPLP